MWIETLSLLFGLAGRAGAVDRGSRPPSGGDPGNLAGVVRPALRLAELRLGKAGCLDVFGDFRDESGSTLLEDLDHLGLTPVQALEGLKFLPCADPRLCERNVYAGTLPGNRVVWVCEDAFRKLSWEQPSVAANVLIHELLHTLGLAHDSPSSGWITSQVAYRCGG